MSRHLISIHDLTAAEVAGLFRLAADVKRTPQKYENHMHRKTLAMIFEKSSTRTRVSFEVGMFQMGGHALFLSSPRHPARPRRADLRHAPRSSRATSTASWPAPSRTRP